MIEFQSRVICADGSVRWLEWNTRTSPERGVVYGVARDATERRVAEANLQRAQRTLEESRNELRMLADEQVALRRVATLVARETPPEAVFAAVVLEVGELLGPVAAALGRFDADGTVVSLARWGSYGVPLGARYPLEGDSVSARVLRTGRPAQVDGYDRPGVIAATVREIGIRFSIGVPISVQGRTWGVMILTTNRAEPFPPETESRLEDFTELVATAIANASGARGDRRSCGRAGGAPARRHDGRAGCARGGVFRCRRRRDRHAFRRRCGRSGRLSRRRVLGAARHVGRARRPSVVPGPHAGRAWIRSLGRWRLTARRRARMTGLRLTTRPHGSHPARSARARRWPHPSTWEARFGA